MAFSGYLGGFWPFLLVFWSILSFGSLVYVVTNQIRCPSCNVQLLSRKGIKSPDNCYNCGRDLNGPKPVKRDVANDLMDKYGDERAARTNWTPLKSPSANFNTHNLHISKTGQHAFKPTWGFLWFGFTFVIMGLIFYTIVYFAAPYGEWLALLPLIFVIAGLFELKNSWTPIRVDTSSGKFVLGWGKDDFVRLEDITSLQLLPVRISRTRIKSFQLNLVLTDGSRKNIVSFFGRAKAVNAAQQLAEHLSVSLWNGIDPDA